jgi:hypothetical protein
VVGVQDVRDTSAHAVAGANPTTQQVCKYADGSIDPTWHPGDPPCTRGGSGAFAYAADTSCSAITITTGGDNFQSGPLWSNGGFTVSGAKDNTSFYQEGDGSCPDQPQFVDAGAGVTSPPAGGYTGQQLRRRS